jgi:SAM-dependent methyltransferase
MMAVRNPARAMPPATDYDRVDYPGHAYPQTHPDRLAALARLFGLSPADPARCRILELGCGDGANLLPIAEASPGCRLVGIDLAATAVDKGRRIAQAVGLANLDLRAGDIADLPADLGEFDYVIAHGVYSWVPEPVREALLAACRRHLAPQGVAFVSYNVLPGGHLRRLLREAMLMHLEGVDGPAERTAAAREFLGWVRDSQARDPESAASALAGEAARAAARNDAGLFHDDLSAEFHLPYFRDFCEAAARHGLQFLAEAEFAAMQDPPLPPGARAKLDAWAPGLVEREQYRDFLVERRFRQSLLCHAELSPRSDVDAGSLAGLSLSCSLAPQPGDAGDGGRTYRTVDDRLFATGDPAVQAAIARLHEAWPRALPIASLVAGSFRVAGEDAGKRVMDFALAALAAGLAQAHARQPDFASAAGERPLGSALARLQSAAGTTVTGRLGNTVLLDDEFGRRVLALLDGTRDRAALIRETGAEPALLDRCLAGLARLALLRA